MSEDKRLSQDVPYMDMLQRIKKNVREVEPGAEVWLYGSRARRDARRDSDWDVLVVSPKAHLTFKEEETFMDHICDLIVETGLAIQIFAYGKEDWHKLHSITPFYQNVQKETIRL